MAKKIRRRVISETKRVALVVNSAVESDSLCPTCGEGRMVSPLLAAKLLKTGTREIYRSIENDKIHFVELPDRQIFVCAESLEKNSNK